ncbi:MAG TPA: hypothetical protein VMN56_01885 [Casimicrobiaceae bacterium]|nr:hypothetical protein [Casimicrobiaceae bacterium]
MQRKQAFRVVDTMNAMERTRASREAQQAMRLGHSVDALVSGVRNALADAGRAMTLVYGRSFH